MENRYLHQALGKKGKDKVTRTEGIVTGACMYLTGSPQLRLEGSDASGRRVDAWFDIDRIVLSAPPAEASTAAHKPAAMEVQEDEEESEDDEDDDW